MADRMSPPPVPPQQARPFSPYQQSPAHSPPGIALPPAKRPRMSPSPSSPESGVHQSSDGVPFGHRVPAAGLSFNAPQPHGFSPPPPATGMMGPPPRPGASQNKEEKAKEKINDINDLSDAIFGSGVDLREEENYLTNTLRNIHGDRAGDGQIQRGVEGLQRPIASGAFSGSGPVSQGTLTMDEVADEVERKHHAAAQELAKQREKHLRAPFLSGNSLRHHLHKAALEQGVTLDTKGLHEPNVKTARTPQSSTPSAAPSAPPSAPSSAPSSRPPSAPSSAPGSPRVSNGVTMLGPKGVALASVQTRSHVYLEESSRYADILSLLSLAANERIRALLDEAYTLARGRRYGSHGVVPTDFRDMSKQPGDMSTSPPARPSISGTPWEAPDVAMKDGTDGKTGDEKKPTAVDSYEARLNEHLGKIALGDRDAERARIKKRQERAKRNAARAADGADANDGTTPLASGTATPVPGTPGATGDGSGEKPMTKKERERQAKIGLSEEVLHKNANVTAAMALGFGKSLKKKFSWMTGAAASAPTNPFARPTAAASTSTSSASKAHGAGDTMASGSGANGTGSLERGMQARERRWGDWREDGIEGRGIQLRDWAAVLERSGREKKALEKCFLDMDKAADGSSVR